VLSLKALFIPIFIWTFGNGIARAGGLVLETQQAAPPLLELFSSEGCSSCPPADAWLSRLRTHPNLWTRWVPIAFHVDYWNRLGWYDRFSKATFTQRQRAYAAAWGVDRVYTPAFVMNGREWHPNGKDTHNPATKPGRGKLRVTENADGFAVDYRPTLAGDYELHAALLGNGLVSHVTSGENNGSDLIHDFVVLQLREHRIEKPTIQIKFESPSGVRPKSFSIAVWITRTGEKEPVQVVGGDLPTTWSQK
jgi:hypothetical protein